MPQADQHHQLQFSSSHHKITYQLSSQEYHIHQSDQHHELHSSSSHQERTYELSSPECQEQINTMSFIPAPATMRELTNCQAKNARSRSTPRASMQLQSPGENLPTVKPKMPGADQHHELHSSSSHHERTYSLSSQECQEQINTMSFIPAPATMRELTCCQAKNARSRSRSSASFQLQSP
jgi:hypothetical protein